jgi:hypothetical protein
MFSSLVRRRPSAQLTGPQRQALGRVREGREASDDEVIRAIRSIPKHYAVGPTLGALGTTPATPRYGTTGESITAPAHGKYYEAASRGVLFSACQQGTGTAPGTALGTTAFLALYNPAGSQKRLVVGKVAIAYVSGTLGIGILYHCIDKTTTQVAPSGGTALTVVCTSLGNNPPASGVPRVNATVAATLVAYRPFCTLPPFLASTAVQPFAVVEDMDGELVVEPGCSYQLQAIAAAGTSPLLLPGITWEEVPVV